MRLSGNTGFVIHRGVIARSMVWVRMIQLVNAVFGALYALFTIRFILEYARANEHALIVVYLDKITDPIYRPFHNVLPVTFDRGGHPLVWSLVVAVVALAVVHAFIRALLRIAARPAIEEDEF